MKILKLFLIILPIVAVLVGGTWEVAKEATSSERTAKDLEIEQLKTTLTEQKAATASAQEQLTRANANLANANTEINSLRNATITLVFYMGDRVDSKQNHFHLDFPLADLLKNTPTLSHGGHSWEDGRTGFSDFDNGLCKAFTIHATTNK